MRLLVARHSTFHLLHCFDVENDGPFRVEFHALNGLFVTSRNRLVHFLEYLLKLHATCVDVVAAARKECCGARHREKIRVSGLHLQQKFHKKSGHGAPVDPIAESVGNPKVFHHFD